MAYDLYRLLLLANPQESFGLVPSTKILFAILNRTMALSSDVVWDKLSSMFIQSPFFSKFMGWLGRKRRKDETLFPKRIDFVMGSRMGHTLGQAVFSSIISEANFQVVEDQTYETFNSVIRRMESRFSSGSGSVTGKIWVDSSETDTFSAVNQIMDSYKNNAGVYVSRAALWEVKSGSYGDKRFWVFAGTESRQPEILQPEDPIIDLDPLSCIQVPLELKPAFEADLDNALRDIAGRATASSYRLFRLQDRLIQAMVVAPLFPETFKLDFDDDTDQMSNHCLMEKYFKSPLNPNAFRFIHIDIGLTGDLCGIAASYVSSFKTRKTMDLSTLEEVEESVPVITTEWAFGMYPTPGKQVPLFKIRSFIRWLSSIGYPIGAISTDGFASEEMHQLLQKMHFTTELLSLDRTTDPYIQFRNAVYEGRCQLPRHELLKAECMGLTVSSDGKKIDHPAKKGSKDIADAVAGSVFMATREAFKHQLLTFVADKANTESSQNPLIEMFWTKD
jgi:hypothetical protein